MSPFSLLFVKMEGNQLCFCVELFVALLLFLSEI